MRDTELSLVKFVQMMVTAYIVIAFLMWGYDGQLEALSITPTFLCFCLAAIGAAAGGVYGIPAALNANKGISPFVFVVVFIHVCTYLCVCVLPPML